MRKVGFLTLILPLAMALLPHGIRAEVLTGIDVLEKNAFVELKGKRIGLITNRTGRDKTGHATADVLAKAPGVELKALFSPEHGFSASSEAAQISSDTYRLPDGKTIPLFSLYGATKTPTADMLKGLDALVFDIQDIGARFYTYATTMAMAMEAASRKHLDFIVLDRPNPLTGEIVEGPILDDGIRHFTAYFPVPVRHGLTVGEIARLHNFSGRVGARLQVVALEGWSRSEWYDQTGLKWVKPSPNIPDLESATLYSGIGCLEATNVSVGRGTQYPLRWVGAPWMDARGVLKRLKAADLKGVRFKTEKLTPTKEPFVGKKCRGILIEITDRKAARPLNVFAHIACALRDLHPMEFGVDPMGLDRMTGTVRFRELYERGAKPEEMIKLFEKDAERFKAQRAPFLLY